MPKSGAKMGSAEGGTSEAVTSAIKSPPPSPSATGDFVPGFGSGRVCHSHATSAGFGGASLRSAVKKGAIWSLSIQETCMGRSIFTFAEETGALLQFSGDLIKNKGFRRGITLQQCHGNAQGAGL